MVAVRGHPRLGRHARTVALIPLHVVLVRQSLLRIHGHVWRHVATSGHVRVLGHAGAVTLRG